MKRKCRPGSEVKGTDTDWKLDKYDNLAHHRILISLVLLRSFYKCQLRNQRDMNMIATPFRKWNVRRKILGETLL